MQTIIVSKFSVFFVTKRFAKTEKRYKIHTGKSQLNSFTVRRTVRVHQVNLSKCFYTYIIFTMLKECATDADDSINCWQ